MKELKENCISEFIAKRRVLERAVSFFYNSKGTYFIKLGISYNLPNSSSKKEEEVIVRKEVISTYLGLECSQYWESKNNSLSLTKEEYLELWELLKANPPIKKRGGVVGWFKGLFKGG